MKFTHREIFGVFIVLITGLLSLGSWKVFFGASLNPDLYNTSVALVWFSFLGASFLLGAVVWQGFRFQVSGVLALLLPSLLFVHEWYYFVIIFFSGALAFLSIRFTQQEIADRIRFHFFRSVRAGSFMFILALSLVLSGTYFASIQQESWEELVKRFSVGEGTATAVFKTSAYFYPEWKTLATEGTTVDEFLLSLKEEDEALPPEVFSEALTSPTLSEYLKRGMLGQVLDEKAVSQELYLRAGRDQIASLLGRSVSGDEKIADVFSLAVQRKIITALSGEQVSEHFSPTIIPFVLTLLLFFTLLPFGSVTSLLWISSSFLVFRAALFFGWMQLGKATREQDTLLP
jgi:hypothetical protein